MIPRRFALLGSAWAFAALVTLSLSAGVASAQFTQQSSKLVGSGAATQSPELGFANQGTALAISRDGSTIISGGYFDNPADPDNYGRGAVWIFARDNNGDYAQQGGKIVPPDMVGEANFGWSVALSANGNTAIIGGFRDDNLRGAAWIYVRNGSTWSKQAKLIGTNDNVALQGQSVSISDDGNTAVVGGPEDGPGAGAVWVFTRTGTTWSQKQKLVAAMPTDGANLGYSVAISGDGGTIAAGAAFDNNWQGSTYVFRLTGGSYAQEAILVGQAPNSTANDTQGFSVALSQDGNRLTVGAPGYNDNDGALYHFFYTTQMGTQWIQSGDPAAGEPGDAGNLGYYVTNSSDGKTIAGGAWLGAMELGNAYAYTARAGGGLSMIGGNRIDRPDDYVDTDGLLWFGQAVAMSGDGKTLVISGAADNQYRGAIWIYSQEFGITSVTPGNGPPAGGTSVTISGSAFAGITSVKFGGIDAASFTVDDPATITAVTPANDGGPVDVTVATADDSATLGNAFTYDGPYIANINPAFAGLAGGTQVTIQGLGFTNATSVTFGGAAGTALSVDGPSELTVTVPSAADAGVTNGGKVTVVVVSADGNATKTNGFTYYPQPSVSNVSPASGSANGGTAVTITGTGFTGATGVTFAVNGSFFAASDVVVVDDTTVTAVSPPVVQDLRRLRAARPSAAPDLQATVDVVNPLLTSEDVASGSFTYLAPPVITSISPSGGPPAGGTVVTINGSGFTGAFKVVIGASGALFTVNSDSKITATSPGGAVGAVDVVVMTPVDSGTSPTKFTYAAAPTITAINPNQGPASGGTLVTIVGTNLTGLSGVKFGATASTSFSASSPTLATATAPPRAAGAVQVTATTYGSQTSPNAASNKGLFTYTPTPVMTAIAKFAGGANDGGKPFGGVVADPAGILFGTASVGGKANKGVVYKLTPSGNAFTKTILHHFDGATGATPYATLIIDSAKNLYGVTTAGGAKNKGVIFKLAAPAYKLTVLYSFKGDATDGGNPYGALARDAAGVLYGTTTTGGSKGLGTTFTLTGSTYKVTHHFTGAADGDNPRGNLIIDASKNIYGTSYEGGAPKQGVAFKLAPNGTRTIMHTFGSGQDGKQPYGGLFVRGTTYYGTTFAGGSQNKGMVYKLVPPSTAATTLFNFTGASGANPYAALTGDAAATPILFGTTFIGGAQNKGTVFKLLPPANGQTAWSQSLMYSFKGGTADAANPYAQVVIGKNNTLYGTTSAGGNAACSGGCGTVFKLTY